MCYNSSTNVIIRKANESDIDQIKDLADQEKNAIGFVNRSAIIDGINQGYVFVAQISNEIIGFQQYYHRKNDLQTTLYRKAVVTEWRFKGIGTRLVDAVVEEAKNLGREKLHLKCPVDNESNEFHKRYGFKLIRTAFVEFE